MARAGFHHGVAAAAALVWLDAPRKFGAAQPAVPP